jgi:hypothetical protein
MAGEKERANFDPGQNDSKRFPLPPPKLWISWSFPCQKTLPPFGPSIRLTYAGFLWLGAAMQEFSQGFAVGEPIRTC